MIEVHNLTFGYSSTEDGQILKGVDFAAKTGKLTVLILSLIHISEPTRH